MRSTLLLFLFASSGIAVFGQSFKFRHFSEQDGMNSQYVYTIDQDLQGRLLIGTGEGLFRFDGFQFSSFTTQDSLADNLIEQSSTLSDGSIILGHNNGDITIYRNGKLTPIRLKAYFNSRITDIAQDPSGDVWVSSQNSGIIRFDKNWNPSHFIGGLEEYHIFCLLADGNGVWIGTDMGLLRGRVGAMGVFELHQIDEIPMTNVTDVILENANRIILSTEDAGLFTVESVGNNHSVHPLTGAGQILEGYFIRQIRKDEKGQLWVCTNSNGLIRLSDQFGYDFKRIIQFSENALKESGSVRVSFQDREENLWIGTIGKGLAKLEDDYFSTFLLDDSAEPTVFSLEENGPLLYTGLFGKIIVLEGETPTKRIEYSLADGLPATPIIAIHLDNAQNLWAGTTDQGLWVRLFNSKKFKKINLSEDLLNQKINAITSDKEQVIIATDYGAYIIQEGKVNMHLTIEDGLSGNVVRCLYKDSSNRIWIGTTTSEFTLIENGEINSVPSPFANSSFPVRCFTEDSKGLIWVGTEGIGVFMLSGQSTRQFTKSAGLYSDFCYSLHCDSRDRIWAGHRGAISVIDPTENKVYIKTPGATGEVYFQDNAVSQNKFGEIFFGTNVGLLRYDPRQDRINSSAPIITLDVLLISDIAYSTTEAISLEAGDYKLEFLFSGISLTRAEDVSYQFMLEGYESDWSDLSPSRRAVFNHLPPGDYTLLIKAFNSDGVGGEEFRSIPIHISRPFWQQWWFIILSALIFFAIFRIIIIRRERFLKQNQEYLKHELSERTREVVEQKELLEVKNKDITDSIIYAKNIQKAMLPSADVFGTIFPEAFVYYKPRDIVSGDFYWVEQVGSRVLIACADCTGHGVPGAFMSLIGSILMKEIAFSEKANSPEKFLSALHRGLFELLNGKGSDFSLEDGMDVSLFEYDLVTRKARMASANRPVIMYLDDEFVEVRGDRKAIGGGGNVFREEHFTMHEFQMKEGDLVYLFSDGLTDQFGGERGKKLKRSGLKTLLDDWHTHPMAEQRKMASQTLREWRGALPQLDDIILIGLKC